MHNGVKQIRSNELRRIYAKVYTGQLEEFFKRVEDIKVCVDCHGMIEENVAAHRILWCEALQDLRIKHRDSNWIRQHKTLPKYGQDVIKSILEGKAVKVAP